MGGEGKLAVMYGGLVGHEFKLADSHVLGRY